MLASDFIAVSSFVFVSRAEGGLTCAKNFICAPSMVFALSETITLYCCIFHLEYDIFEVAFKIVRGNANASSDTILLDSQEFLPES